MRRTLLFIAFGILGPLQAFAATVSISPSNPIQGDAVSIRVSANASDIDSITENGHTVPFFQYGTTTMALYGIGISAKSGTSTVIVHLKDASNIADTFFVGKRERPVESLAVPTQLGGNSTSSQQKLVSTLSKENALLATLTTNPKTLWSKPFIVPVADPVITDAYGYERDSGATTITHKGADFRAPVGTSVMAMGRGVVRMSRFSPVYGNTIVVDHGQGLMTMYMHLSKRSVKEGSLVSQGQKIGLSGDTGYSEGAHLHVSVRINGESIDPVEFLSLFGTTVPDAS